MAELQVTCTSLDCPERHGDACQFDLDGTRDNLIRDLCKVTPMSKGEARRRIETLIGSELQQMLLNMEAMEAADLMSKNPWQAWRSAKDALHRRIKQVTAVSNEPKTPTA